MQYKQVFFDGDGVLFDTPNYEENNRQIALSSWNIVFHELGIYHEHERLKEKYLRGEFPTYMEWTDEAVRIFQKNGLTHGQFSRIINSRPLMQGSQETIEALKQKGVKTAIITGSFEELALRAQRSLGLSYAVGHCKLIFDKEGLLKSWELTPCDFDGKVVYFHKIADEAGISYSDCAYVGDNVNDIPIFKEAGLSIAFNATKDEVKRNADIVIEKKDLSEILAHIV